MPPPPVPAAAKEKDVPKRPASRVDNAASSSGQPSRPVVPPAPVKKKATSTLSSTLKGRVPAANPAKPKPTTSTTAAAGPSSAAPSASVKPLAVAKSKPLWGRSAPPAKPVSTAKPVPTAKASTAAAQKPPPKAVVKKPSSKFGFVPKPASKASKSQSRPITPAMIALPPSPTPEDQPEVKTIDELQESEVKNEAEGDKLETEPANEEEAPVVASTPDVEVAGVDEATADDKTVEVTEPTEVTISPSEETANQDKGEVDDAKLTPSSLFATLTNQDPKTPQGLVPKPPNNINASKTPISALLNSIERGFMYSPITPLSPADSYLPNINGATPYSHQTHAPHIQGPMQPFNYALHAHAHVQPQRSVYAGFGYTEGLREQDMIRGDIGVVKVDHNRLFMPSSLPGLDDSSRLAFLELNH
ncbi:hypothetical protein M413DRAFT_443813 [Hebeloma cylindrosporum]|uniref:Uncharacterized protein n=1 Tax=Hebeloma cylindrosporum TaxID=76867 RepID=A0A0C2YPM4_HEBCY|nr:hypothetical protein M413DRAFT_443813 [Hebeloma cylindrosporum h7]